MDEPTVDISSIRPGEVTLKATITYKHAHRIKNGNLMTEVVISDMSGTTKAVWFSKNPKVELEIGNEYIFSGKYQLKYGRLALQSPKYVFTGERYDVEDLVNSPLILPEKNYPSQKSVWDNWEEWIGGAIVGTLIICVLIGLVLYYHNSTTKPLYSNPAGTTSTTQYSSTSSSTPQVNSPGGDGAVTGSHNGITEIHLPGQNEAGSSCIDVTSYDHDWDDDVICTRPDGTKFYTDYAGAKASDPAFKY